MSSSIRRAVDHVREALSSHDGGRSHDGRGPATAEDQDPRAETAGGLAAGGLSAGGMPTEGLADDVTDPESVDSQAVDVAAEAAGRADLRFNG
jgi:hypothetical protein